MILFHPDKLHPEDSCLRGVMIHDGSYLEKEYTHDIIKLNTAKWVY